MNDTIRQMKAAPRWLGALPALMLLACGGDAQTAPELWTPPAQNTQGATNAGSTPTQTTASPTGPTTPATNLDEVDAQVSAPPPAANTGEASGADAGTVQQDGSLAGLEFFQRIAGKWTGINSNTPIGFDFPMAVEFAPSGDNMLFAKYELDSKNNVLWGFNIETYGGETVLAYRNGGYLAGLKRDSRTKLVEHDSAKGYYRFCAVLESGLPVDGCNYIDARYTFSAPDRMLFEVTTRSGKAHVHWDATRTATTQLPVPFPATTASQGTGSAAWPAAAGI